MEAAREDRRRIRRMHRRCLVAAAFLAATAVAGPATAQAKGSTHSGGTLTSSARAGDAVARVDGSGALLADGKIVHRWRFDGQGHVVTSELSDPAAGRQWSAGGSPDFSLTLDSVPTSSTVGWTLLGARAQRVPADPARPRDGRGVEIVFRYAAGVAQDGVLELERTWSLYPGSGVEAVSSSLVNKTPGAFRVGKYSLAEVTSPDAVSAEVQAYHGGSDWRQDFRVTSTETGAFDDEGEVVRFDDGSGKGWFLVAQRRGGSASRVGRDNDGRTWVGVDNARDLLDWGPIRTDPPDYNRQDNPAYPAPVRQRMVLPLGTLDLGTAYLGVYHGGAPEAAATFASDFAAHSMPALPDSVDLNTFHPWGHGAGLSDANLRPQVDAFKALGGETFMLDDQWQGSSAGDWRWDTARFPISGPAGVPDFVDYLHSKGLNLGLWMSPAEFNPSSNAYQAHPDWACAPTGDATAQVPDDSGLGVWDMTNPALRDHLTNVIDRLIAEDGVTEFKFDYVAWVDCPPHDYLDYEDAYVAWVREQEARHPDVTFELDETNDQRMWPFESAALGPSWFDNGHLQGSSYPGRLLHDIWSAAPWVPPSSIGAGTYDGALAPPYTVDYLMPIALLGHVTFWTDLTKLSAADASETAWWIAWYEAHRASLGGLVYEDTSADPIDGRSWAAFEPWRSGRGYLFVFRQGGASQQQTIGLQGLQASTTYRVTDVRTGALVGDYTGRQLEQGLTVTLSEPYSARVLSIDPV